MGTAAEFERVLRQQETQVIERIVQLHRSIALDAFRMIAADTRQTGFQFGSPVWSGWYRTNHNISIGKPDLSLRPKNSETEGRGATRWPDEPSQVLNAQPLTNAATVLSKLKPFDVVYITNPTPYARVIEFGHSKLKAPEGVYEVTAAAVNAKYENVTLKGIKEL